eukprot:COSAG01_NODE_21461_length_900_cov_1.024938_1_plen_20_part_10
MIGCNIFFKQEAILLHRFDG